MPPPLQSAAPVPKEPNGRLLAAIVVVGILVIMAAAWWLEPDPRGHGTHERIGLPACGMQRIVGLPCPFCGMTTAFSLAAKGRFVESFKTQPAGFLVFFSFWALLIAMAGAIFRPEWFTHIRDVGYKRPVVVTVIGILAAAWVYKILSQLGAIG